MFLLKKEEREILMLEYKELLNEILQRRQNTWLIHSILLASTIIISFSPYTELLPYPYIVSLGLVIISWLFQITAGHVNKSCWDRRHEIENMLGMKAPQRRFEDLKKSWKYKTRSALWHILFGGLILLYSLLLSNYLLLHYFDIKLLPFL